VEAIAVLPDITTLHFRAVWMTRRPFRLGTLQPVPGWHKQSGHASARRCGSSSPTVANRKPFGLKISAISVCLGLTVRLAPSGPDLSRLAIQEKESLSLSIIKRRLRRNKITHSVYSTTPALRARSGARGGNLVSSAPSFWNWSVAEIARQASPEWLELLYWKTAPARPLETVSAIARSLGTRMKNRALLRLRTETTARPAIINESFGPPADDGRYTTLASPRQLQKVFAGFWRTFP